MEKGNKNEYFDLFDQFNGSILLVDSGGAVQYANKEIEKRTGFYRAEIIGNNPGRMWGGKMEAGFYENMWAMLKRGRPVHTVVKNRYKHTEPSFEYLNIIPISNGKNQYFLEIHPKGLSAPDIPKMKQDFNLIAQNNADTAMIFEKISFWLSGGVAHTGVFSSMIDFCEEHLIAPIQKTFAARTIDKKLIQYAQKKPEQFEKLYNRYYADIFNYFLPRLAYNHDQSGDLTQEVFERAFRHIGSFTLKNASYKTYLLRIAHNQLVNEYRKKHEMVLNDDDWFEPTINHHIEITRAVSRALDGLSLMEREIIERRYFRDYSVHEIATELGKTENAVKLHLSRARKRLKSNNNLREIF